jgi:hypothetical protein
VSFTFPPVVPYLYYPDANEALEFLVRAFGFEEHAVTRDADGVVWNAQLRTGSGLVMIGPGRRLWRPAVDLRRACRRVRSAGRDPERGS